MADKKSRSSGLVAQFPASASGANSAHAPSDQSSKSSSSGSISKTLLPLGPALFKPPFDVVRELTERRDRYQAYNANPTKSSSSITIYSFPLPIAGSIDRIRDRAGGYPSKPSISITVNCCASNGISMLTSDEGINHIIRLRSRLNNIPLDTHEGDFEEVKSWFENFDIVIPENRRKQINLNTSEWVKGAVSGLAHKLGVTTWELLLFSVMMTLVTQRDVLDSHRTIMKGSITKFFRRIEMRRKIGDVLLDMIDPINSESGNDVSEE